MSDPNPPEQPSFNRPAGGDPTTPLPSSQPPGLAPRPGGAGTSARRPRRPRGADGWSERHVEHPRPRAGRARASSPPSSTSASPTSSRRSSCASSTCWRRWPSWRAGSSSSSSASPERRHRARRAHPRADLRHHLPRRHPHDPRVLPLGRAHERGHPQAPPPGLTRRAVPIAEQFVRTPLSGPSPGRAAPAGSRSPRQRAGCCWVMQWMPPPRAKSGRASTPTTRRPG